MSIILDPALRAWEVTVPKGMREDLIWKFHTYRVALYLAHLVREDLRRAKPGAGWRSISDQLLRSVTSIGANIAEGYGRSRPADRTRFYDVAFGSLRETKSWYDAARLHLPPDVVDQSIDQLAELRRMPWGAIRALRRHPSESRIA
jgi:four helix bundle protein